MKENSESSWDNYWEAPNSRDLSQRVYSVIASFYRKQLIGPRLRSVLTRNFAKGSSLLHAGCGAGEVDLYVPNDFKISALDISIKALEEYSALHKNNSVIHADLLNLQLDSSSYDGIYNLGVMEHFTPGEVDTMLATFHSLLKKDGKLILFWPPSYGSSVIFLKIVHAIMKIRKGKSFEPLHPDEPNKLTTRKKLQRQLRVNGFSLISMRMSPRDGLTYMVVVAQKATKEID